MSWQKTDLVRRLGDKRLPGERQPVFLALLDSSVIAEIGAESKAATFARASAQYGRTLTGLTPFAIDVPAIETFIDAGANVVSGYLSEEERTRFNGYASDFASWDGTAPVTPDDETAPDGTQTADRMTIGAAGVSQRFISVGSLTPNTAYAPSIWIKKTSTTGTLHLDNPAIGFQWNIDLALVGSGWERIVRTHPAVSLGAGGEFRTTAGGVGGLHLWADPALDLCAWIAQCEFGAFETSSIVGAGSAVRAPTLLRYAGGRNVCDGPNPRTYVCRFVCGPGRSGYLWSISDGGSAADRIYATIEPSTGRARVRTAITAGATGDVTGTSDLADGEEHEVIVQLAANNLRLIVDGAAEGTPDTTVAIPQNLDRWDVGASEQVDSHLNGNITYLQCSKGLVLA